MHDVLEGALQYEVKLMLKAMVQIDQYFSIGKFVATLCAKTIVDNTDDFNSWLINLELGYMEVKDKPTPISSTTLSSTGHSLKQAGIFLNTACCHTCIYLLMMMVITYILQLHRCGYWAGFCHLSLAMLYQRMTQSETTFVA